MPELHPESLESGQERFERLQTWCGADYESEWFNIPTAGFRVAMRGFDIEALPHRLEVVTRVEDARLRATFRVSAHNTRIRLTGVLANEGFVVLKDAFGVERLQLLQGAPALAMELPVGRYFIDALLPAPSTVRFELQPAAGAAHRGRARAS